MSSPGCSGISIGKRWDDEINLRVDLPAPEGPMSRILRTGRASSDNGVETMIKKNQKKRRW